eukprot:Amastigsp_a1562_3.p3 type:complete len:144 gc:universal Amastigsp_a1562_3:586-155(-)
MLRGHAGESTDAARCDDHGRTCGVADRDAKRRAASSRNAVHFPVHLQLRHEGNQKGRCDDATGGDSARDVCALVQERQPRTGRCLRMDQRRNSKRSQVMLMCPVQYRESVGSVALHTAARRKQAHGCDHSPRRRRLLFLRPAA